MKRLWITFFILLGLVGSQPIHAASPYLPTNYDEPYRGQYHFSQQSGWMNDINGLWYYNGTYYLTFQTTPNSPNFDFAHTSWGMATSPDMMHWTQKSVIAEPNAVEGTPMSGSAVIDTDNTSGLQTGTNPVFIVIYTSEKTGQCLLYSNDLGLTWQRYSANPVINTGGTNPRDPHVQWYAPTGKWVMVLYRDSNGTHTDFYSSPNLKDWTLTSTVDNFGHECPDFFELPVDGDTNTKKWVLWAGDGGYLTGSFDGSSFTQDPGGWHLLDNNNSTFFYASQTFNVASLPNKRVVQIAWQGNPGLMGSTTLIPEYGNHTRWNQNATFPTVLSLKTSVDGLRLCANPIPEISDIWASTQNFETQTLTTGSNILSNIKSKCFDITAEFNLAGTTATEIKFLLANKTVTYNVTNKTLNGKSLKPINNILKIRILGDWSQYEIYGNDGLFYWSERFAFDPYKNNLGLTVNGNVTLNSLTFHEVGRTWPGDAKKPFFTKYEAESGTVGGGAVKASYASASGGFQAGVLDNIGANFQISVYAPTAVTKTIALIYANGMGDNRYKSLYVNGVKLRQLDFLPTGGWNQYSVLNTDVTFNKGKNTLKIQRDSEDNTATDVDYFLMPWGSEIDTTNLISPQNPNIQYMGRVDFTNLEKPLFAYPNVTIKTKFEGTSLEMLLNNYNGSDFSTNYFISIVDGKTPVKFQVSSDQKEYSIAKGLSDGIHTAEIVKVTESYCGECEFLGFKTDSAKKLLTPDPLPDLKLEFYGNSITCGYGIEGGAQPTSENSYKAYPSVAAHELNAQYQTISYSGIGVVKGFPTFLMSQMYNRTIALTSYIPFPANNIWDFTKYVPDFVVVALGTNDYNLGFGNGTITTSTFNSGYKSFISRLRTAYPNAQIICTNSPMISDVKLENSIKDVVDGLKTAGDAKVNSFKFSFMQGGGDGGHPGVADGQTHGKELAAYISSILTASSIGQIDAKKTYFTVYPNPVKNTVTIKSSELVKCIELSDFTGKILNYQKIAGAIASLDMTEYPTGIYFLKATNAKGAISIQKVVKN